MKKTYHHPTFVQYKKKSLINLFPPYSMKKNKTKEKKLKREKNWKFLKRKKIKGKKLVASVLGAALLCSFYGATVKNTLFEDDNDANTFRPFNPTQIFLHLKKYLLLARCEARANILVIILLRNGYFLKYFIYIYIY